MCRVVRTNREIEITIDIALDIEINQRKLFSHLLLWAMSEENIV